MKTNNIGLMAVVAFALLLTGCTSINSGNVGKNIKPLPYGTDEVARITKKTMTSTNPDGGIITFEQETKTGLQVNSEIQHHRLDMATKVGVAQAKSTPSTTSHHGFWAWLLAPPAYPYYGGDNGYCYGGGGYSGGYGYYNGGSAPAPRGQSGVNYSYGGGEGFSPPAPQGGSGVNYNYGGHRR